MKKTFLINLFLLIFLNLLIKPFWIFGIDRTVQNITGAESYGLYFTLFNLSVMFGFILDFGVNNYNNKTIAQNQTLLNTNLLQLSAVKLLLAIFYFVITIIAANVLNYSGNQITLLYWLCFNQFLASFLLFLRSFISGLQFFKTDAFFSVIDRLIMIVICLLLMQGYVFNLPFKIEWFVYAQTFAYGIACVLAFFVLIIKTGRVRWVNEKLMFFQLLKSSMPFALLTFLMTLHYRLDSILIERILPDGLTQAGLYAQAFRLTDALLMFSYLFAVILFPLFSKILAEEGSVRDIVVIAFKAMYLPALAIVVLVAFYASDILAVLYKQQITVSPLVLIFLSGIFLFSSANYIFGALLTANGFLRLQQYLFSGALSFSLFFNIMLIPIWGIKAAAAVGCISHLFVACVLIVICINKYQIKSNVNQVISWLMYILIIFVSGYTLSTLKTSLIPASIIIMGIAFTCILIFNLFPWKEAVKQMKQNIVVR
jgi:O-antigen/teichoic acid export membrane protein